MADLGLDVSKLTKEGEEKLQMYTIQINEAQLSFHYLQNLKCGKGKIKQL